MTIHTKRLLLRKRAAFRQRIMCVSQSNRSVLRQFGVACLAVFQIGITVSLPPADALLDIERFGSPQHIESSANNTCAVHGHLYCQVVRSLSNAGVARPVLTAEGTQPPIYAPDPGREACCANSAPVLFGAVVPRAPPSA